MKKKWTLILLCVVLSLTLICLCACIQQPVEVDTSEETQKSILFLGDSIGEAVAGPSPIQERINYGYFGIIGQINDYKFDNRAISGNQTKDMLSFITREGEDGNLVRTLIHDADIIHVSILGNDLLQYNFPTMLLEVVAKEKYGENYTEEQVVKDFFVYHNGNSYVDAEGNSAYITPGWGIETVNKCLARALQNIGSIVDFIKAQNPDAVLMFQKVYNPVDEESELISSELLCDLVKIDPKYDYANGGAAEVRKLGEKMIGALDGVLDTYLEQNPGSIIIVDALTEFDKVYKQDEERGMNLIYPDGVHPSNEGHAVLAATIQSKLVELNLAKKEPAINQYKELRIEQLSRMYEGVTDKNGKAFDLEQAKAAVQAAVEFDDVSVAYFDAVKGYTPKLYSHPTEGRKTNGVAVEEAISYDLSEVNFRNLAMSAQDNGVINSVAKIVLMYLKDHSLTLNPDGTMEIAVSADVGPLIRGVSTLLGMSGSSFSLDGITIGGEEDACFYTSENNKAWTKAMGDVDMARMIELYVTRLFPGIDVENGNVGSTFGLTDSSIGLGISGADSLLKEKYTDTLGLPAYDGGVDESTIGKEYNSYLDFVLAYLSRYTATYDYNGTLFHMCKTPEGLTEKVTELEELKITVKCVYSLKTVKGSDGTEYEVVYAGQYYEDASPWLIFTKYTDNKGVEHLKAAVEIMGIDLVF